MFTCNFSLDQGAETLESSTQDLFKQFRENHMRANTEKYHLLLTSDSMTKIHFSKSQAENYMYIHGHQHGKILKSRKL